MKICVLIKQVPDKNTPISINDNQSTLKNENITWVTNESDSYALEEALRIKESHNAEVVVCSLGPQTAEQVLKDAMAKGADRSILISDEKFINLDILSIAKIFKQAIKDENFDIILSGLQSDDQGNSQLGLLIAEMLNMSHASLAMSTEILNNNSIKVKRELENGWFQWTELNMPTSISIQSGINTPRYATLKGIMMVKNKEIKKLSSNEINMENISSKIHLNKLFIPEKTKETQYIEGSADDIASKLVNIFKNEIKILN